MSDEFILVLPLPTLKLGAGDVFLFVSDGSPFFEIWVHDFRDARVSVCVVWRGEIRGSVKFNKRGG